ncbi:MAG: hypothetical protein DMF90_12375 [Acidobacteria bacterium]|nr:MAG: hypothetical protein DMF90_12375 [Acidobacteriota bacterium]
MMRLRRFVVVTAVLLSLPSFAGCFKATGGGKLTGPNGESITTGFQLRCDDVGSSGHITGEFQYRDHGTGVAFHAVIDQFFLDPCESLDQQLTDAGVQGTLSASGTYTPQPTDLGLPGTILVVIQDQTNTTGATGCNPPDGGIDSLAVQLTGGFYGGRTLQACLEKGNFTVFSE